MALKGMQIIAAEFRASGDRGFAAVNPATGTLLEPRFREACSDDIDRAAKAAADSFDQYRMLPMAAACDISGGYRQRVDRLRAGVGCPGPRRDGAPESEARGGVGQDRQPAEAVCPDG